MRALVAEIRVESRQRIQPTYCLPAVRVAPPGGSVLPTGRKSNPVVRLAGETISLSAGSKSRFVA